MNNNLKKLEEFTIPMTSWWGNYGGRNNQALYLGKFVIAEYWKSLDKDDWIVVSWYNPLIGTWRKQPLFVKQCTTEDEAIMACLELRSETLAKLAR